MLPIIMEVFCGYTVSKFCISIDHTITLSYILPSGSSSVLKIYRQYPKISCPHSRSLAHVVMAAIYMFLCINQPLGCIAYMVYLTGILI